MFNEIKRKYDIVNKLVEAIDDKETTELSKFLGARIACPDSYIVMLGETSSGKTTLLNGLLGGNYLFTSVRPSTGAIVELAFTADEVTQLYYAINKNATMERLTREEFIHLSKQPDSNLSRLRLEAKSPLLGLGNLRLFDTPGYGSIIEKHEELLSNFLPESNVVLYVVSYKVGIQQDDFNFLNYASELIAKDTEFVLIINRTPDEVNKDDRRIAEITGYVSDILHYLPRVFLVPNIYCEGNEYPLPQCKELWDYVQNSVASEKHIKQLEMSFNGFVFGLLEKCESIIDKKILMDQLTQEDKKAFEIMCEEIKQTNQEIKELLIEPAFSDLISIMPSKFSKAKVNIKNIINEKINSSDKLREVEVMAYVNSHMLQFETKKQVKEISSYIEAKLDDLDRQISDKLNKEYTKIQQTIELHFSVAVANMAKDIFKKAGGRALEESLLGYFKQFAGRGGTGIANASKHLLKKFGDLFGKTFSRQTHNKLASTLSKIGATSAKAVGFAVAAIIEAGFIIYDIVTWQGKLIKSVDTGVEKWYEEVVSITLKDLSELKEENIRLLDEEANGWIAALDTKDSDNNTDNTEELKILLDGVKKELGEYKYE